MRDFSQKYNDFIKLIFLKCMSCVHFLHIINFLIWFKLIILKNNKVKKLFLPKIVILNNSFYYNLDFLALLLLILIDWFLFFNLFSFFIFFIILRHYQPIKLIHILIVFINSFCHTSLLFFNELIFCYLFYHLEIYQMNYFVIWNFSSVELLMVFVLYQNKDV